MLNAAVPNTSALPLWQNVVVLAPAVAALVAGVATQRTRTLATAWALAKAATVLMIAAAVTATVTLIAGGDRAGGWLRIDPVGVAMISLVSFLGWVIVRYSQSYLAGDPQERSYISRLLTTLGMVAIVVVSNHFVVLFLAWTATSVALHRLLTFYSDRPVAMAVAHKKFLLARGADLCMAGAAVAFATTLHTLRIDRIVAEVSSRATMPGGTRVAIMLIAVAALLKCAQLPFHGWLIQVMEAPTPVSALLHGGIVNLGGFVLLRFAPVVDRVVETRVVLVVVGSLTAVVAAIVMTTRISVKVALAWSTCAQMGFMLLQCGLGVWEMALLHIVAHSLYKAHAFLGAGGVVRRTQHRQLLPRATPPSLASIIAATFTAIIGTLAAGLLTAWLPFIGRPSSALWVLGGIVAVALVPLIAVSSTSSGPTLSPRGIASAALLALAYFALHGLFVRVVPHSATTPTVLVVGVALAFMTLFAVQTLVTVFPTNRMTQRLYPWFYGGLFLDETFTRWAFRLWPPPPSRPNLALLPDRQTQVSVTSRPGPVSVDGPTSARASLGQTASFTPTLPTLLDGSVA